MSKELIKAEQFCKAEPVLELEEYKLTEEEEKALQEIYEGLESVCKKGSIVTGTVLEVSNDGVLVDINFKSEGLLPLHEFNEHELKKFKPGSKIDVIVEEFEGADGKLDISYQKAKMAKAWENIMKLYDEGKPVEGVVLHKVKGGLSVDIGIPAFLPGSQVDVQHVANFDQYVGQVITAYILKVNPKRGNVIISRRKYLNEQRSESRKKILDTLTVGQTISGVVKNITNYGAFLDIGGIDGLLHITDMTWGRIAHPSELLKVGDTIAVKILSFDRENEKVSLGLKQLEENPWEKLAASVQPNTKIKGRISSITDYGLFVEVEKGVEGLVHISEISWSDRVNDLQKHFKVGDVIEAMVMSVDKENRRMSLSIKQLEPNPWDLAVKQFSIGQKVKGKITNVTDFGLFVQLMAGIDGLIHVSDISWTEHIKNLHDLYKKGEEVEAIIVDINEAKKKISLSIKHLSENPWEKLESQHPVGSIIDGEVVKIGDAGAFIKIDGGIEGFLHISEIPNLKDGKIDSVLKVGQKEKFRIVRIGKDEHKLSLSMKLEPPTAAPEAPRKEQQQQPKPVKKEEQAKPKSQLQIELEKHAARLIEEKDHKENKE